MTGFISLGQALVPAVETANAAYQSEGFISGLATGFRDLDLRLGGLQPSELIVVAARTAMGKSALAINIGINAARARLRSSGEQQGADHPDVSLEGAVVGMFSLETRAKSIANRILANDAGIPYRKIRQGMLDEANFKTLVEAAHGVAELPIFIDDSPAITVSEISERALKLHRENPLGLLIVDYLQLISGGERQGEGRHQEISEITAGLKALSMRLNIPIVALSQLSRGPENREDRRPVLTDLVGSGSIENDADVVLFLHREEYYTERQKPSEYSPEFQDWMHKMQAVSGLAEVIVAKHRQGPTGTVHLQFDADLGRFSDLTRDSNP